MKNRQKGKSKSRADNDLRIIAGKNTIGEVVKQNPSRIVEVWVVKSGGPLFEELKTHSVKILEKSQEEISEVSSTQSHQGIIAWVKSSELTLKQLLGEHAIGPCLIVAAIGIEDPQNLGGIFRAAECLGACGVLYSRNKGADITATVSKVGVGGTELVPHVPVGNFSRALKQAQDAGFWLVATDCGEAVPRLNSFKYPERTVLMLGSEGKGLGKMLLERADFKVQIPMQGKIDSLNVNQATSVLMYEYCRQQLIRQEPS